MGKWMYSCEQAAKLSSQTMDQPLGPWQRMLLNAHLMMCSGCTNFTHQIAFLRRASRKIPEALDRDEG